jgi:hypothetical protein
MTIDGQQVVTSENDQISKPPEPRRAVDYFAIMGRQDRNSLFPDKINSFMKGHPAVPKAGGDCATFNRPG